MRAVAAASLTVLLLALACVAGARNAAPAAPLPALAPFCPDGCPEGTGALRPWFPGKVLWRAVSFPFRRQAPRNPICPRVWR